MANHTTGAQRRNARMDKIFEKSEKLGNHSLHGSTEKRQGTSDGYMVKNKAKEAPQEWSKKTPAQKKKWLDIDKGGGKKMYTNVQGIRMVDNRDKTMKALDKQKARGLY
jgi:hypothetical protein